MAAPGWKATAVIQLGVASGDLPDDDLVGR
jgi:hypothetical protein